MALGKAVVDITANIKPLSMGLSAALTSVKAASAKMASAAFSVLSGTISRIISLTKIAAISITGLGVASVKSFADAQQSAIRFNAILGDSAKEAENFIGSFSKQTGIATSTLRNIAASFFGIIDNLGLTQKEAEAAAETLTKIAVSMKSVFGGDFEQITSALSAGILSNARALRQYGIVITDDEVKQAALNDQLIRAELAARAAADATADYREGFGWIKKEQKDLTKYLDDELLARARLNILMEKAGKYQVQNFAAVKSLSWAWTRFKEVAGDTLETIGRQLEQTVIYGLNRITQWLADNQPLFEKVGQMMAAALQAVAGYIEKIFGVFQQGGISAAIQTLMADIGKAFNYLLELIKQIYPYARQIGVEIGAGIAEGLKGVAPAAAKKTGEWMKETSSGQAAALAGGALIGGKIGAAVGSVVPGVGTLAGGGVGALAGAGIAAGAIDEALMRDLIKATKDLIWSMNEAKRLQKRLLKEP